MHTNLLTAFLMPVQAEKLLPWLCSSERDWVCCACRHSLTDSLALLRTEGEAILTQAVVVLNDTWRGLITSTQIAKWCLLMRQVAWKGFDIVYRWLLKRWAYQSSSLWLGMRQLPPAGTQGAVVVAAVRTWLEDVGAEVTVIATSKSTVELWGRHTLIVCKLLQILLQINLVRITTSVNKELVNWRWHVVAVDEWGRITDWRDLFNYVYIWI